MVYWLISNELGFMGQIYQPICGPHIVELHGRTAMFKEQRDVANKNTGMS
jgi:hypothetical protein